MSGIRLIRLAVVPLTALAFGVAACGGGSGDPGVASARGTGGASRSPSADAAGQAAKYAECLRGAGVKMTSDAQGNPQVDKEDTPEKTIVAAGEKCRDLRPVATAPPAVAPEDLDKKRQYAACIRDHGFGDYPDPDPQTGESALSDQLAARLKGDVKFGAAQTACNSVLPSAAAGSVNAG